MKTWGKGEGGYVFLSHSHHDIEKVRKLRNALEEEGFEVLCFYLKCLTDEDEIEGLIKREIDSREWFVYVDSENARNSEWVRKERAYIETLASKRVATVELDMIDSFEATSRYLLERMRVFLSYARRDREIAAKLREHLLKKDFKVFWDYDMTPADDFLTQIEARIAETVKCGYFLVLLSEHSVKSFAVMKEIEIAIRQKAALVLVRVGQDVKLPEPYHYLLNNYPCAVIDASPTEEQLDRVANMFMPYLP